VFTYGKGDKTDARILLGDNTGGGAVMLRPIRFQCAGVWISAGLACMYITTFKPGHPIFDDGTCFHNVSAQWRTFPSAHFLALKKKSDDSLRLHVVEIARVA